MFSILHTFAILCKGSKSLHPRELPDSSPEKGKSFIIPLKEREGVKREEGCLFLSFSLEKRRVRRDLLGLLNILECMHACMHACPFHAFFS